MTPSASIPGPLRRGAAVLALAFVTTNVVAQVAPEGASGWTPKTPVTAKRFMIVAAHPLATDAGFAMLRRGGSAADAAIAAQLALNVVEPQSSGIGGGAFLLHFHRASQALHTYDGRETAPARATPELFLDAHGKPLDYFGAVIGGRAVGAPGLVRMLAAVHRRHGRLPWADVFAPAIRLANDGFALTPRLHALLRHDRFLRDDPAARGVFYDAHGAAKPIGTTLRNPALAATLKRIAAEGPRAFYEGAIAADIVRVVNEHPRNPGTLSTQDIADFRVRERAPLCAPYREWRICGMAPPSSGATTVLQILKLLEPLPMRAQAPDSLMAAHLFTEAGRLAYADRARYLGDPDFVSVPVRALLDERYLDSRRAQIDPRRTLGRASAGQPERLRVARIDGQTQEEASTTHLSVVDADGNAVALSSSIESAFGSRVMAAGFLLNNQLTDFAFAPRDADGVLANRVEPRKRPRSSMAPTMVFDRSGRLVLVIGSPGGTWIIPYVAKTLVGVLDWQLSLQAAIDLPHVATPNGPTFLERGTRAEALKGPLELLGHEVRVIDMTSGLHGIHRVGDRWVSGADPRREGIGRGE